MFILVLRVRVLANITNIYELRRNNVYISIKSALVSKYY